MGDFVYEAFFFRINCIAMLFCILSLSSEKDFDLHNLMTKKVGDVNRNNTSLRSKQMINSTHF